MSRYIDSRHLETQFDEDTLYNGQEVLEVISEEPTAEVIPLDRIKELRGDVSVLREERRTIECHCGCASDVADEVLELIDKLIAESEG